MWPSGAHLLKARVLHWTALTATVPRQAFAEVVEAEGLVLPAAPATELQAAAMPAAAPASSAALAPHANGGPALRAASEPMRPAAALGVGVGARGPKRRRKGESSTASGLAEADGVPASKGSADQAVPADFGEGPLAALIAPQSYGEGFAVLPPPPPPPWVAPLQPPARAVQGRPAAGVAVPVARPAALLREAEQGTEAAAGERRPLPPPHASVAAARLGQASAVGRMQPPSPDPGRGADGWPEGTATIEMEVTERLAEAHTDAPAAAAVAPGAWAAALVGGQGPKPGSGGRNGGAGRPGAQARAGAPGARAAVAAAAAEGGWLDGRPAPGAAGRPAVEADAAAAVAALDCPPVADDVKVLLRCGPRPALRPMLCVCYSPSAGKRGQGLGQDPHQVLVVVGSVQGGSIRPRWVRRDARQVVRRDSNTACHQCQVPFCVQVVQGAYPARA